jgi:phage shock protein A
LALQEKIVQGEKEEQFGELYERNKLTLIELEDRIHLLKTDYNEVLAKRQYYLARLESIKLQQKMNERQHNAAYIASQTFQRLDDRISDMEYESNALRDIRRSTQESFRHAGQSVQHVLEREMDKLKAKLEQEGWGRA